MEDILFLAHRLPYPPDKGDKIRSWQLLRHFAATRRVHLGCFVDDPADWAHAEFVRSLCADAWIGNLSPRGARARSLVGLARGGPLTFPYFWSAGLARWVSAVRSRRSAAQLYAFSSSMAQYVTCGDGPGRGRPLEIVDLVDLDSEKWRQYAQSSAAPMKWIFRREAEQMARAEVAIARRADLTLLVSNEEAADLRRREGVPSDKVHVLSNGVDADYFDPARAYPWPCGGAAGPIIVFTGAMDYRANADAAIWFARVVLPLIREHHPTARFFVVGARPTPDVLDLQKLPNVVVTGRVPDVRPWLAHATVVVAPLRLARGIQNKVLEAMAMARPVVCSPQAQAGIGADPGVHLLVAGSTEQHRDAVCACIEDAPLGRRLGLAARALVETRYRWEASLAELDHLMSGSQGALPEPRQLAVA